MRANLTDFLNQQIWPQVKAANSHLSSVTEIGAIVGAIWRELDASQKQQYNEYFIKDKVVVCNLGIINCIR